MTHTLLMYLAGPMQAWGFRSRFDNRDTGLEPTRSGVIGLLCAALGWERSHALAPFEPMVMGVRVEKAGRVAVDYHTAQPCEFDKARNCWVYDKTGKETTVSPRYYLADARFLVGLQSDDLGWLQTLEGKLKNPCWPLFLGRKAFAPSLPIHLPKSGLRVGEVKEVLAAEPWHALSHKELSLAQETEPLRLVLQTDDPRLGVAVGDVPRDFERRHFGLRYLRGDFCAPPRRELHPTVEAAP
jgi:CRISPR system Cascade subunit CasD